MKPIMTFLLKPHIILATVFFLFLSTAVLANQTSPLLDPLFVKLSNAKSVRQAQLIEYEIIRIWNKSGHKKIDQRMEIADDAMREGFLQKALKITAIIISKQPNFSEGWNLHATILYLIGQYEESLKGISKTLALEPRHFGALIGKGRILAKQHKLEKALEVFQIARKIYPLHPRLNQHIRQLHLLIKLRDDLKGEAI